MNRTVLHFVLGSFVLALAACGTSDETLENAGQRNGQISEQIEWGSCESSFPEGIPEAFAALGERLQCATLKAPLDWGSPKRGEIDLGVLRVRAGDEAQRKGAIFVNPGGPGGDGFDVGAFIGLFFAQGEGAAPELFAQVSDQYDVIGFSPRGVGRSTQLTCNGNLTLPDTNLYTDRSPRNVFALLATAQIRAAACRSNPLYRFIDTGQTVQDMDFIRRLLGDEKLNYLGYSYGSWLGSWYAKRFPENAGNIVLDANTDFSATFQESFGRQPLGFQRAFEEVALPYVARNNAIFELGESAEGIGEIYEDLPITLKEALLNPDGEDEAEDDGLIQDLFDSADIDDIGLDLVAAQGVSEILEELGVSPSDAPSDTNAFLEQVAAYTYLSNGEINEAARIAATVLANRYIDLLSTERKPVEAEPSDAVFRAVRCNDSPWIRSTRYYIEEGNEQDAKFPLLGGDITEETCAFWTPPTASKPDVPQNLPPILLVQTGYDAPTPVEGALEAFESLPGAKLVYIENEVSHTSFPYGTECVDARVAAYLLDGTLPDEDVSNCEALPLPGEDQVFPPGVVPSFGSQSLSVQTAPRPAEPSPIANTIHEIVRKSATYGN